MIIGITGGCGAGKSTVTDLMSKHGGKVKVIKADHLVGEILKNHLVKETLIKWWGEWLLGTPESLNQDLDRLRIAHIVFNYPDQLQRLETYLHPMVRLRIKNLLTDADEYDFVILDAPLLFESNLDKICDSTVFVEAPYEQRLFRVKKYRNWDEDELIARESAQISLEAKKSKSNTVIHNWHTIDVLDKKVEMFMTDSKNRRLL